MKIIVDEAVVRQLEEDVDHWKMIANDLWWWLDYIDGDEAAQALENWPELGDTEEYLGILGRRWSHGSQEEGLR